MLLIYIAISFYKCLVHDYEKNRCCGTFMVIVVTAAVTAAVLVVVGSALSTQNG